MKIKWLFLSFLMAATFSISHAAPKIYEFNESGADVKIPVQIWDRMGVVEGRDTITFAPARIKLIEKTSGVLVEPEIEIRLPRGGGEIDLAQFVKKNVQGTFKVLFDLEAQDAVAADKTLAFFISRTKKRKLDGEVWGAGCKKFMDIKKYLLSEGKTTGIEVNTTKNRHISVIGGTFFFSMAKQVTQVTFKDSQQTHLFCDQEQAQVQVN